jgi:hypothetical protein
MSTLWSVFYGVLLANITFYLFDIAFEAIKTTKRKRDFEVFLSRVEDLEDDD